MTTKSPDNDQAKKKSQAQADARRSSAKSTAAAPPHTDDSDPQSAKQHGLESLAAAMPYNASKESEFGDSVRTPVTGTHVKSNDLRVGGSTLSESNSSAKTGSGQPTLAFNTGNMSLDRARSDSTQRPLTTNLGVSIADNQNSLKAGLRGPALLEDFILREKITHFDHERIPERIVHARGSGAHGYFENYKAIPEITRAAVFSEPGKRTPVFVRFSTVVGERGSADTARDARGFAVKFYTEEGNWDLVGNNIPVFFIQDAMKFPDLVHAAKPEPHFAMPQAATAHDTFWDFVSLMPESVHMLMWVMSDRALPRSYRMMQGFGVHSFRLVNALGEGTFVKFHWRPKAGTHSLDWDECVKIAGADPDFHRRDLWEAIEAGAYPEWELSFQMFTDEQAEKFSFDVLDATKIVPEELAPLTPVGRMVLNRNPNNFFAETEQVAFCTANIVPGIDFSNDPLLAGRIHSYHDTQLSRLGGPNFHELPINAPLAQAHNNQRDGMHRHTINRGRVAYEPNSLGGGCPFQAGLTGFSSFRQPVEGDKVRAKPERFADHYTQARLFWNSQTPIERTHIIRGFRFELTKVQVAAVRRRTLSMLANVDAGLAEAVASGLGMEVPEPMPLASRNLLEPEISVSPALSLFHLPGEGGIATRRVAILCDEGCDIQAARSLHAALSEQGAVARYVAARLGSIKGSNAESAEGDSLEVDATFETMPSVLFDAVAVLGGKAAVQRLGLLGQAREFVKDQYRHAKPILMLNEGSDFVQSCGVPATLSSGEPDPGLIRSNDVQEALPRFIAAIARHRHHERELDPPPC
ncbi:MAG TPA: catalase [Polyangiaceae bacterium]|jgi:catalase|nr:catalase [Polyangiaceae bacterium]